MGYDGSEDQIQQFEKHGVLCLRGVIELESVEIIKAAVEKELAEPGPDAESHGENARVFDDFDMWHHVPEAREWATIQGVQAFDEPSAISKEIGEEDHQR